jgi:AcrR family transcriptional regulator
MKDDLEQMLQNERFLEILDRAAAIYSRSGYEGTGIRDLASALSIKSASLYHYFSGKEDILFSIMWKFHSRFLKEVTPLAEGDAPPDALMRTLVGGHIRFDMRHWNDVVVSLRERNSLSAERRNLVNNLRRRHRDAVVRLVQKGAKPGTWASREPVVIASTILDMINGLVQWYKPRGEADLAHMIEIYASNAVALMNASSEA